MKDLVRLLGEVVEALDDEAFAGETLLVVIVHKDTENSPKVIRILEQKGYFFP